ncbi:MAG: DUF748 domain-containing protein [Nitrospira sp.]|nr:DUF748 domain-containing protein [Nitrospira sp.]
MRRFFRPIPLVISAVILLAVYAVTGFFLLPYVIKSYVLPTVAEQLGRPVLVQAVQINPFALSITVTGFEIREADQTALLGFERLHVNFEISSLVRRAYRFDEITLAIPFVSVRILPTGQLNLLELAKVSGGTTATSEDAGDTRRQEDKKPLPPIEIRLLQIDSGIVEFRDESKRQPFEVSIVPIEIRLQNFTTRRGGESTYAFSAEVRKEELLNWEGYVSLDPIESAGKFSLTGVRGPVLWLYVKDRFNFDIPDGRLNISARYRFDTTVEPFNLTLADGEIGLTNLALTESGKDEVVISVPSFLVHGINVDVSRRNLDISSIESKDALFKGWMDKDRTVNFQTLFTPQPSEHAEEPQKESVSTPPPPATDEQRPWLIALKEIALKNYGLDFEDRSTPTPAHHRIAALNTTVKDLHVPFKEPINVDLGFQLNDTGSVHADGTIGLKPFETNIGLHVSAIPLKPLEPYLEGVARVAIESGSLDMSGDLHLALEHPNAPMLTYNGNFGIRNLAVNDRNGVPSLVSWKQLQLKQVALTVDPTTVAIEEVGLDQPAVHFSIQPDGQSNLGNIRPQSDAAEPTPAPTPATSTKKGPPPVVSVKTVKLLRGSATFVDESIKPTVRTGIHDLTGTIKGLSSKQLTKADVELTGRMDKVAPLKISGVINPLTENTFTDLLIKFENVDLTTAAPYSGKYAGYPISKGKLFLDLAYKVSKKQLEAENKVAIDQLTFGEKTDSPDATSLPVPFAVALLKDRNGRIDIDLPIRGDLNDPDFKYGKVVISTLLNLLAKMVASPFALVGKLIPGGGSGEELQYVEFAPGSAIASDEDLKKVDALVKALAERPGLRLEITGTADPVRDRQALGYKKLSAELLARWTRERGKSAAGESLPANDEQRLLKELYAQRRASTGAAEPARTAAAPPSPPSVEEMRRELAAAMPFEEEDLRTLAHQRAEEIRNQLTGDGKLKGERVYLVNEDISASEHERIRTKLGITAS